MYDPAVALESTATITPCLNLNAKVVVPWANLILKSLLSETNGVTNSAGYNIIYTCHKRKI